MSLRNREIDKETSTEETWYYLSSFSLKTNLHQISTKERVGAVVSLKNSIETDKT